MEPCDANFPDRADSIVRPAALTGRYAHGDLHVNWTERPDLGAFLMRLRQSPEFGADDLAALSAIAVERRVVDADATIVPEGRRGENMHLIVEGWAARSKILENGSRQIPALLLPGEFCDLDAIQLEHNDCGVVALTRCAVITIPRDALLAAMNRHRGLRDAVWRMMATENTIATQWTVCLGRRSARERLAHLLCELRARLVAVGAAPTGADHALPLTQEEMADVLGLTAVHVNRTLQKLRGDGLIRWRDGRLSVLDEEKLRRLAGFNAKYLHLPAGTPPVPARPRPAFGTASAFA